MIQSQEEHDLLMQMISTRGWKIFKNKLEYELQMGLKKLRKANNKLDVGRFNNRLDGIEFSKDLIEKEIEEYEATH